MKLHTSYSIICVFALLSNKVSVQDGNVVAVSGVTGGSVVLPCATSQTEHKLSDITVQWRKDDSLLVCAIIEGTFSLQHQHLNYKNRTESFPTEYKKGNFSIKLNNLTQTDAGGYWCYITHLEEQVTLITQLTIKEATGHTCGEKPPEENENQARETHLWKILIPVFCVFMLCLVLCIIWKKRCKDPFRQDWSPVRYIACRKKTEVHGNGNESRYALE